MEHVPGHSDLLRLPAFAWLSGWPFIVAWFASWSGLLALLNEGARPLIALFPAIMWVLLTWFASRPAEADFRASQAGS